MLRFGAFGRTELRWIRTLNRLFSATGGTADDNHQHSRLTRDPEGRGDTAAFQTGE